MLLPERESHDMLKRKPPAQLALFVAGSLEQPVPDDHILACVDRVPDPAGCTTRSPTAIALGAGVRGSIRRWLSA